MCSAGVEYIFLSEHSCESSIPQELTGLIQISSPGIPQRIKLKGHDEYTLKFSFLEKIANYYGYAIKRGPLADFLVPKITSSLKLSLASRCEEDEEICHFVEDLFLYEYLFLARDILGREPG